MSAWFAVWQRNFLVWRKLALPSLLGNFGEPLLYLLALGYGLGAFVGTVQGLPYIVFLASGIVCASAMNAATLEGTYSAYVRMSIQQTWEGILVTPLGVRDVVLGELAWTGSKALINAGPILVVAALLGAVHDWRALWVLPMAVMVGLTFGAMALVVTAFARGFDFFLYYATLVVTPMFLLSGVFFPLHGLPALVRDGAGFLPLSHAVEIVRPLMTGQPLEETGLHLLVLMAYAIGGFLLAVRLFRRRLIT
jgi:lipooligosaccharide transport system permease protein